MYSVVLFIFIINTRIPDSLDFKNGKGLVLCLANLKMTCRVVPRLPCCKPFAAQIEVFIQGAQSNMEGAAGTGGLLMSA